MYEVKTKVNDSSVIEFIDRIENPRKREDAYLLLKIFSETTGLEAKMWGESMIGFGSYHYKYKSGHEGDAFLTGFAPRKAKMSLYIVPWDSYGEELFDELGKHTRSKACVYVNKLADIEIEVLKKLIALSIKSVRKIYPD
jgi:hypothetical protein